MTKKLDDDIKKLEPNLGVDLPPGLTRKKWASPTLYHIFLRKNIGNAYVVAFSGAKRRKIFGFWRKKALNPIGFQHFPRMAQLIT